MVCRGYAGYGYARGLASYFIASRPACDFTSACMYITGENMDEHIYEIHPANRALSTRARH